ncbi:alpha/beta hydrolase [Sphaerochaeta sp.]|uniref:alpha/beta fold hydrolase n=1 Tax=Sphaerochaeta sp. TaxID=1972642 RepID=UPI002A367CA2|nr:alpha/beta hydrolase [Sphaerochaeta sp.]MDX9982695.1 alpha/beta hydrolase [Sphaerochaeta sp.]
MILNTFLLGQQYVETSFSKTFILEGKSDTPPMVLLHGSCSTSAAWLGDLSSLSREYHVYAVDILGEPGNSEEFRLDLHSNEYSHWLGEVLDALSIQKAVLMGNSLGGWLALHFGATAPERVKALILLASAGIVPPKQAFVEQTEKIAIDRSSAKAVKDTILGDSVLPKEVLQFMMLVFEHFNPIIGTLPILSDVELARLFMPVLFIAGKQDATMDTTLAADRLMNHVPQALTLLLEGSHVITSAADTVFPFLAERLQK